MRRPVNHYNNAMEQLTFGACVKKGWISSWQAITQMPWLFLGACAVFVCTSLLRLSHHAAATATAPDAQASVGHALMSLVWLVLQLAASATLSIKVHRFVLLGEGANPLVPHAGKPLGRLALMGLVVAFVALILAVLTFAVVRMAKLSLLVYVPFLIVYIFVFARMNLLYPSIALGSRFALRAAWRGRHVWSITGVTILTYAPLVMVLLPVFLLVGRTGAHAGDSIVVNAMVQALFSGVFVVFAATSLSWLYRRYAQELLTYAADKPV
ncbi:MAG: hypothetical protein CPDRYMAC_2938 [uncultured Paraburkholderia sp.]|nr:MAG: hypothetical protein CPDRYDRY_5798 [uncultured Paraburkholderia sp.]CAH2927865.1 MAG: hypothetical protein CPDRYMAC_2938 [uncultured Paraburkholderia sp.]